jgi:hypothetical protein
MFEGERLMLLMTNRHVAIVAIILSCLSVWEVQCVAAAKAKTTKKLSTQKVISQWRVIFPNQPYVCWQKKSPWEGLDKLQSPPAGVKALPTISVDMGRNEYESTSFVLTNLADKPTEFKITAASCDPKGISTTLRKAVWVAAYDGTRVNEALSLIDNDQVVIPSGESLEIWATLHGDNAAPGKYQQIINVSPQGLASRSVNLAVTVYDVSLPKSMPLAGFYWEAIVPTWPTLTPELIETYMKDLKSHYVDHATIHPDSAPRFAVDANGHLITDYTVLDATLDAYKTLAPKRFIFFWASESFLEPSGNSGSAHPESKGRPKFLTPEWQALFREWLGKWVAHMKARGIGYDAFIMHPYDERLDANVIAVVKLIKEVDPKIQVLVNPYGDTVEQVKAIAPYVDACAPYLYNSLDAGGVNGYIGQVVSLKPNTAYTCSFYFKNGSANLYYELVFNGSTARRANILDAADWTQETLSFTTSADTTQLQISFYPTVGNRTLLMDDVVLRAKSGPNLIVHGDMEAGNPPEGWTTGAAKSRDAMPATVVANTTDPRSGKQCAEVTNVPTPPSPTKKLAKRLRRFFWIYAHPTGSPIKADIYQYFRAPVWQLWKEGMTGSGVWTYRNARWDGSGQGFNWGMVYRTDVADCPPEVSKKELVVPGKRWEAIREGVEDYAYLYLLTQAIRDASPKAAAQAKVLLASWIEEVLKEQDNPQLADKVKKQIMEKLVIMSFK